MTKVRDGRGDRDGAVGLAYAWDNAGRSFSETFLARVAAAQLVYIGWLWQQLGLRDLVEVDIRLQNPSQFRLYVNQFEEPLQLQVAPGISPPLALVHRAQILSSDLARASTRHRLVWEFSAKVCHAYGKPGSSSWCFTEGLLYRSDGHPSDLVVVGGGFSKDPACRIWSSESTATGVSSASETAGMSATSQRAFCWTWTATPLRPQNLLWTRRCRTISWSNTL